MIGTWLNLAAIGLGGLAGLAWRRQPALSTQRFFKMALGVYTVWIGLRITAGGLNGSAKHVAVQLLLAVLAMMLGRLLGKALHVQKSLNQLGRSASAILARTSSSRPRAGDGFKAAAILLCAAPLAVLGPIQDGLNRDYQPLLLKGVMDGLVVMALVPASGWTVLLAGLPMAAVQVTFTLGARACEPWLRTYSLFDSLNVVCGLLIFCLGLIIFAIRRVEVGDYLPAVVLAPLLTWLWG
jgi:uncharacterized protein